jgi:hypothetical protein
MAFAMEAMASPAPIAPILSLVVAFHPMSSPFISNVATMDSRILLRCGDNLGS